MSASIAWPRYVTAVDLADGSVAYYWRVRSADRKAGFKLPSEALGKDFAAAKARADALNRVLDDWRSGRGVTETCVKGTVRWWFRELKASTQMWRNLAPRTAELYEQHLNYLEKLPVAKPRPGIKTFGDAPLLWVTPKNVDKLYEQLQTRTETKLVDGVKQIVKVSRIRQADLELDIMKKAWRVVARLNPAEFPEGAGTRGGTNPFVNVERVKRQKEVKPAASREEAYALAYALRDVGHAHLGAAAIIAFEWLQRPEHTMRGICTWSNYKPGVSVTILHPKTGATVEHPLRDVNGEQLYPELETYLAGLARLGDPIVMLSGARSKEPRLYSKSYAAKRVREARAHAKLSPETTLDACRHGGLTELGDAEVTEQEGMATSGHKTPDVYRRYVKPTMAQRLSAARKRRAWINTQGGVPVEAEDQDIPDDDPDPEA